MADKTAKAEQNVSGTFYVDTNCISCGQCGDVGSDFFAEDPNGGFYVKTQPTTVDEIEVCEGAMSNCPVGAIGNDG